MNKPQAINASVFNAAECLADFAAGFVLDDVPDAVIERAKLNLLDALGIGLASTRSDFAGVLASALDDLSEGGSYPVIGMDLRLPIRDAAHLNGTLVHGLDFDDTHSESVVHTSASAAPTALMGALRSGASGAQMLASFIVASECAARIGAAARGGFHEKGFHPTGVVGAFGATLGAGLLEGLSREQLLDAQGIVLSKAGGSLQFLDDGAWTKRNHPGWASACALTAVAMARAGYFGPRDPYQGRFGLYPLHTSDGREVDPEKIHGDLGERWEMLRIAFKPYPACHLVHAFADAMLALKREHGFVADDVVHIRCLIHPDEMPVVCEPEANKKRPQNSYDAQFSVHYVVACVLIRDRFGLAELEEEVLTDEEILSLCERISYAEDKQSAFPEFYSGAIEVELKDGRTFACREQQQRGTAENPMSEQDIRNKFRANAAIALGPERINAVEDCVSRLETMAGIQPLIDALCGADASVTAP